MQNCMKYFMIKKNRHKQITYKYGRHSIMSAKLKYVDIFNTIRLYRKMKITE